MIRCRVAPPRFGLCLLRPCVITRLPFFAKVGSWGLGNIRGVPLPCATIVCTTSNPDLLRSVTSLRQSTSGPVHEGLRHRRIPQRRCAFFLEQSLLFPRR